MLQYGGRAIWCGRVQWFCWPNHFYSNMVVAQYGVVACGFVGQTLLFLQIHQTVAILALQMDAVGISMPTATLSKSVVFDLAKSQKPDLAS